MVIITGINGFVGKHLARELSSRDSEIIGIGSFEDRPRPEIENVVTKYYKCDITDPKKVADLDLGQVEAVINLAGLANTGDSFKNPELYMKVNVDVVAVLGAEILRQSPRARMLAISSGTIYDSNQSTPLFEDSSTVMDGSPYALSKIAMEEEAKKLKEKGLDCVVVRPFNHIGPGQALGFLVPDLVDKLQKMDRKNSQISVGNIKTIRDYTDVRDIARAYADLATAGNLDHNLYNVCSGVGYSGEDILKAICKVLDINYDVLVINEDTSLIRPSDPKKVIGDHSRLTSDTGWNPQIALDKTIADIIATL